MIKNNIEPILEVEAQLANLLEYCLKFDNNLHSFPLNDIKKEHDWIDSECTLEKELICTYRQFDQLINRIQEQLHTTREMRDLLTGIKNEK